jgi:glycosyltransferase involved in cell wall biosynthesis
MPETPAVSVIIATYNRAGVLAEAIASVRAQTFEDWELLVVDDGSSDGTAELIKRLSDEDRRLRYVRQDNRGQSAARNAGLRQARGAFVAFLDDDDLWLPEKLALQVARMRSHAQASVSYTGVLQVDPAGRVYEVRPSMPGTTYGELFQRGFMRTPAVMARRTHLEEAGFFDEDLRYFEDYDLWLRLARTGKIEFIPYPLVVVRRFAFNMTTDALPAYQAEIQVLRRYLNDPTLPLPMRLRKERVASTYYGAARWCIEQCAWGQAMEMLSQALKYSPRVGLLAKRYGGASRGAWYHALKPYLAMGWCGIQRLAAGRAA